MTNDTQGFKTVLEHELALLEEELKSVGRVNPNNPDDWEATAAAPVTDTAELEQRASEISDFEDRSAVEFDLEKRYNQVKSALARISDGTFGICAVCGEPIEVDRLKANPAANTCKAHRDTPQDTVLK